MRRRRVIFDDRAQEDLRDLGAWIAGQASASVARRYLNRIRTYCAKFDIFSERGTLREDLRPDLRIIGFEGRASIAFVVLEDRVVILRALYGGRDVDRILGSMEDDT